MNKTSIDYLDYTYNPIAMKCSPISSGCQNCWAISRAKMLAKNPFISKNKQKAYAGGPPMLDLKELSAPLHLKKPARIGCQFMGDLWHEKIDHFDIAKVWDVARKCKQHTFFFLTKRPERLKSWTLVKSKVAHVPPKSLPVWSDNCWLGISVEDQKTADERIPILLQIPAAHRWVSVEPMLGPINFRAVDLPPNRVVHPDHTGLMNINLVVCGGETGPHARPLHPDWVKSVRDQCQAAGVPFFFKNWGEWKYLGWVDDGETIAGEGWEKVGHKHSGHLIDGKEYREIP